jgi:structural maintenance of chromosome 4
LVNPRPFHPSFTSVVGPNGSGKSNVIDSLLFVFGFKAKKLRQGKLADLVHKSSAFPDLDSCMVGASKQFLSCHYCEAILVAGVKALK